MKRGTSQIYKHVFYKDVKWDELYQQSSPALFIPPSSGDAFDMSNFDEYEDEDVHNVICEVNEDEQSLFASFNT